MRTIDTRQELLLWGPASVFILLAYGLIMRNPAWFWPGMAVLMALLGAWSLVGGYGHTHPGLAVTWRSTLLGTALGFGLYAGAWLANVAAAPWLPEITSGLGVVLRWAEPYPLWLRIGAITLIAPGEELFWRRLLLDRLYHWGLRDWWAALGVSSLAYGAVHLLTGSLWLALAALGFGLVWGAIALWTRNTWTAIVCHAVYDVVMFVWLKLPGY